MKFPKLTLRQMIFSLTTRKLMVGGIAVLGAVCMFSCSRLQISGGSTDTGNARVALTVYEPGGKRAANASVIVRPVTYVSPINEASPIIVGRQVQAVTNDSGYCAIDSLAEGDYFIEVNNRATATVVLKATIRPNDGIGFVQLFDTLRAYAAVEGAIPLTTKPAPPMFCQVFGLERIVALDSNNHFLLRDLPAGNFTLRIISLDTIAIPAKSIGVSIVPGASVNLPFIGWKYSKPIILNTGALGANVQGLVTDFPVLIRLSNDNFPFSQAEANGEDLRFSKANGTALKYQIERWDAGAKLAEVWVKVDTIFGNDSAQHILMTWGATAFAQSNGAAVFDTAEGYAAVWHFSGDARDATGNKNDATDYGTTDSPGVIGNARKFNGYDSIKIAGLLGSPSSLTLSAWAQMDTGTKYGGEVLSMGNAALIRMDELWSASGTMASYHRSDTTFINTVSKKVLVKTGWHYLTYVVDLSKQEKTLFVDGEVSSKTIDGFPINYTRSVPPVLSGIGPDTYIGKHGTGLTEVYNFVGLIDEVRVCKVAQSADYIRLCFMNQKEQNALVK